MPRIPSKFDPTLYFKSHSEPQSLREAVDVMGRGRSSGIMSSSDKYLGCHSAYPRLVNLTLQASSLGWNPASSSEFAFQGRDNSTFRRGSTSAPHPSCSGVSHLRIDASTIPLTDPLRIAVPPRWSTRSSLTIRDTTSKHC